MENNSDPKLTTLSEAELAKRLGISRVTVWRLRRDGKLSYYRVGRNIRYGEQHIAEFLASCERRTDDKGMAASETKNRQRR